MKLSVVVPCYNFEEYIEQCILSLISQKTDFDFEILIGNDCSTDRSLENINRILFYNNFEQTTTGEWREKLENRHRIKVFDHPENIGGFRNLDVLLSNSEGKYISYLDGDDYFTDPYKLQKQVDFMEKNPEFVLTFTGYWTKDPEGNYSPDSIYSWLGPIGYNENIINPEDLLETNPVTFGKVFRNIFKGKTEWYDNIFYGDWMMVFELSKYGKIKFLDYPAGVYRRHSGSVFGTLTEEKKNIFYMECREKINLNYNEWKNTDGKE